MADKSSQHKRESEKFKNEPGNQTPSTPGKKESQQERGHGREEHGHSKKER